MLGLELVVLLAVAVLLSNIVGQRLHVAQPVLQLAFGVLLGFLPALRAFELPPEVVLLLFLPALLYWESLNISLRSIRYSLRVIVLLSIFLVIFTAACVATVAHWLGMEWGPAWVLGAAVAPTDATAVAALGGALPRRSLAVLRGESLVNDGTALVIYGIAVGVTAGTQKLTVGHVGLTLLISYVGGVGIGLAVAWLVVKLREWLTDPLQDNVANILVPFGAYLAAEAVGASGVLAVVVAGVVMTRVFPRIGRAAAREQSIPFWRLATTLLNGALFVLVGIATQGAVRNLTSTTLARALVLVGLISATVIGARFFWVYATTALIRTFDRRPQQRERRAPPGGLLISASAGFRGAVSLAAALAVPQTVVDGSPFPDRDLIVFVVAGVIAVTLVVQAFALPRIVARAHLPEDTTARDELVLAETQATQAALDSVDELAEDLGTSDEVVDKVRRSFARKLELIQSDPSSADGDQAPVRQQHDQLEALELAVLRRKRDTVVRLRDENQIDDSVLMKIQGRLDLEETRLTHPQHD